jgi:hypothetical protein
MLPQARYRQGLALQGLAQWEAAADAFVMALELSPEKQQGPIVKQWQACQPYLEAAK